MSKSYRSMFLPAVVVLSGFALLLAGCGGSAEAASDRQNATDTTTTAESDGNRNTPDGDTPVATTQRTGSTAVEAFGTVKAAVSRSVSLDFAARVSEVHTENGQRLSLADTVLTIDMSEFEHEIDALRDELEVARFEIAAMNAERELDRKRIQADITFVERRLAEEEEEYARREVRHESGALSRAELASYRHDVERLRKDLDDLRLRLEQAEGTIRVETERARTGALESAIARMRSRTQTDDIEGDALTFPFEDGVVTELTLSAGDRLEAGRTAFRAIDLQTLFVEADVLEEFVRDVSVGASVEIIPIADRSIAYSGTVQRIPQVAITRNNETVVPVHISIDDPDAFLRHGFNVDVYIRPG